MMRTAVRYKRDVLEPLLALEAVRLRFLRKTNALILRHETTRKGRSFLSLKDREFRAYPGAREAYGTYLDMYSREMLPRSRQADQYLSRGARGMLAVPDQCAGPLDKALDGQEQVRLGIEGVDNVRRLSEAMGGRCAGELAPHASAVSKSNPGLGADYSRQSKSLCASVGRWAELVKENAMPLAMYPAEWDGSRFGRDAGRELGVGGAVGEVEPVYQAARLGHKRMAGLLGRFEEWEVPIDDPMAQREFIRDMEGARDQSALAAGELPRSDASMLSLAVAADKATRAYASLCGAYLALKGGG